MPTDKRQVAGQHSSLHLFVAAIEYMVDAAQRSTLFFDILRQRGNQYREYRAAKVPHVLSYRGRVGARWTHVRAARKLYLLARSSAPKGVEVDPTRRPFVVVDPRAGNGPGIGGFKADSEIGVALKAGHPCYFVGFMPGADARTDARGRRAS